MMWELRLLIGHKLSSRCFLVDRGEGGFELSCGLMPLDPVEVDRLLDAGDLEGARAALANAAADDERFAVVRIKLGLYDGSIPSGAAMQALIQLMRRDPAWPGAKALYQEASNVSYRGRSSSAAYSHPPPPPRADD